MAPPCDHNSMQLPDDVAESDNEEHEMNECSEDEVDGSNTDIGNESAEN